MRAGYIHLMAFSQKILNSLRPSDVYICICNLSTIGSNNGLLSGQHQAIIRPKCWNIVNWTLRNKLQWNPNRNKFIHFHSRKCIWKCHLENGGHFVSASMCYKIVITEGCSHKPYLPGVNELIHPHANASKVWGQVRPLQIGKMYGSQKGTLWHTIPASRLGKKLANFLGSVNGGQPVW